MDLTWLQPAVSTPGPYTTVHLDASRDSEDAGHEVERRWQGIRGQLEQDSAPAPVLEQLDQVVTAATGTAGAHGRTVIAGPDGVIIDQVVPRPPLRDSGHHGMVAHLMPLVRALDGAARYAVVEVDKTGADISLVDPLVGPPQETTVEGGHDVIHQFQGGGWSQRRFLQRVHDSWDQNASAVAEELDRLVRTSKPELVLVTGYAYAKSALLERLGHDARERVVEVEGGGRADGIDEEAFAERVENLLNQHRQTRMGEVLARYTQAEGQGSLAASGVTAVVEALRGGAVELLLLHDDPSSDLTLWAGEDAMLIGRTREEVEALGAQQVVEERADAVLLRALVAQGGELELVDTPGVLKDGIGAVLRFDVRPPVPGAGA